MLQKLGLKDSIIVSADRSGKIITLVRRVSSLGKFLKKAVPVDTNDAERNNPQYVFELSLEDIEEVFNEINYSPVFGYSHMNGMKIISVSASDYLYTVGIRKGDIIRKITKQRIYASDAAERPFKNIRPKIKIQLDVERKGKILSIRFELPVKDSTDKEKFESNNAAEYYLRGIDKIQYPVNSGTGREKDKFEKALVSDWDETSKSFLWVIDDNRRGIEYFLKGATLENCDFNVKKVKYRILVDTGYYLKAYYLCNIIGFNALYELDNGNIDTSVIFNNRMLEFVPQYYSDMYPIPVVLGMRIEELYIKTLDRQIASGKMNPQHYRDSIETLSKYLSKRFTMDQIFAAAKRSFEEKVEMIADNLPSENLSKEEDAYRLEMAAKFHTEKKKLSDEYFSLMTSAVKTNTPERWDVFRKEAAVLTGEDAYSERPVQIMSNEDILKFFFSNNKEKADFLVKNTVRKVLFLSKGNPDIYVKIINRDTVMKNKLLDEFSTIKSKVDR